MIVGHKLKKIDYLQQIIFFNASYLYLKDNALNCCKTYIYVNLLSSVVGYLQI